ncbi:Acetyl esterase/lipase [Geosmithia morbida]|uniref:Acetyl esterase/lipase n=1 Tax=Geosmithia morbida TaxID=1094350 RepID=A0A9P4YPJ9_9HYPO|nr:Acetyl esterase/lipase [Geosmithia morbida]KAF4120375.1 Acetyl esterase/lipase [Geosmithia morbida]
MSPYDNQLTSLLATLPNRDVTFDSIPSLRKAQDSVATLEMTLQPPISNHFTHEQLTVPSLQGTDTVTLSIFRPSLAPTPASVIYYMHSGGIVCGNRFTFLRQDALLWALASSAVCVTVEYRLAPEDPFPAAVDDCWAGLVWLARHADELGLDRHRIMVAGQSAGGNLAAVMALRARDGGDEESPRVCAQLIDCGMLDDRSRTPSWEQCARSGGGTWSRVSNVTAWKAILGDAGHDGEGSDAHKVGQAANIAARVEDLSCLPPAFVSVGQADGFRDENVEYAGRLWAAGVPTELHVWPGGYHCFDVLVPDAAVSRRCLAAKTAWVVKMLAPENTKASTAKL